MFTRRIPTIVLLATVALLTSIAAAAAAPVATRIEGLYAVRVNNQQLVLGAANYVNGDGPQPLARWKAGSLTPVVGPVSAFNMHVLSGFDEQGRVVGPGFDVSGSDLDNPTPIGSFLSTIDGGYSAITYPGKSPAFGANGDVMTVDHSVGTIYRNGAAVLDILPNSAVEFAVDGSFVASTSRETMQWYAAVGATPITLPTARGTSNVAIGTGGHVAGEAYESGTRSIVRWTVDVKAGTAAMTTYPNVGSEVSGLAISGKGTIAYGAVDGGNMYTTPVRFFKIPLGSAPQDITSLVGGPLLRAKLTDINEWGDLTIGTYISDFNTALTHWSILLAGPRSALTGQVKQSTAASGRSRAARAKAPSLAGKVVTLSGGAATLTAKTNAKGMFRIDVPAGSGYTLSAPKGTCLVTGNGCHASTPLATVGESGAPIKLAKVQVPVIASFLQKQNSKIKVAKGYKAKLKVRCRAKTACRSTVVLRMGRKVLGSAKVVVPKGKTKVVTITLNKAGKTALTRKVIVPVGATLVTRAGKDRATTALSIKLAR